MKRRLIGQQEIVFALRTIPEARWIRKASVFGSYAKGTATPESDVDLLVEYDPEDVPSLFELIGTKNDLEKRLGVSVDLVTKNALSKYIKDEVLASSKTIYVK